MTGRPARRIDRSCPGRRPGFSLVEGLVVVLFVAVLLALSLPVLQAVRSRGRDALTLANLRSTSAVVAAYAADWRGTLPTVTDPTQSRHRVRVPAAGLDFTLERYFESHFFWYFALVEGCFGGRPHPREILPAGDVRRAPFALTCTALAAPEYWDPRSRTGPRQLRATRTDEIVFPHAKSIVVSLDEVYRAEEYSRSGDPAIRVACGWGDGSAGAMDVNAIHPGMESGDGAFLATSIHFFDLPAALHTIGGLRGRDR